VIGVEDSRLVKIRALLATAESLARGGNREAAASYNAKAQELMTRWAIDEALLDQPDRTDHEIGITKVWLPYSPYQGPQETLLGVVSRVNSCKVVFYQERCGPENKRGQWAHIAGFTSDRRVVEVLYTSLLLQAAGEFAAPDIQRRMAVETSHPGHRIRWRNAFMTGYIRAVAPRLEAAFRTTVSRAETSTPGVGLVLVDRRAQVTEWSDKEFGSVRTLRSNCGQGAASASAAGRAAGARADIGQPRVAPRIALEAG